MSSMNLKFKKEEDDRWYIILPEWQGDKDALEMVAGADALCDILSYNSSSLAIGIKDHLTDATRVILHRWQPVTDSPGAYYRADFESQAIQSFDIWLCPVTKFVFNEYPNVIYVQ